MKLLLLISLLSIVLVACGATNNFVRQEIDLNQENQCLKLEVTLNDTVFDSPSLSQYVAIYDTIYPLLQVTPHIDSLRQVAEGLHHPIASIRVVSSCSEQKYVPSTHLTVMNAVPYPTNAPIIYEFGKKGSDSVWNLAKKWHDGLGALYNFPDYYQRLDSDQSRILVDSLSFLLYPESTKIPSGEYWLVVTYQNHYSRKNRSDYWIGQIESDTAWFRVTDK